MWASNVNVRYFEPNRPCDYFIETIKSFQDTKEKNCEYIQKLNWLWILCDEYRYILFIACNYLN